MKELCFVYVYGLLGFFFLFLLIKNGQKGTLVQVTSLGFLKLRCFSQESRYQGYQEKKWCDNVVLFFLPSVPVTLLPISYFVWSPPCITSKSPPTLSLWLLLVCTFLWPLSSLVVWLSSSASFLTLLCCPDVTSGLLILGGWKWLETSKGSLLSREAME